MHSSSYFVPTPKYKVKRYSIICENFESKYGFISGELKAKFETGNIGEESDFFDWYAAKRGLDHWNKKLEILSDISIKEWKYCILFKLKGDFSSRKLSNRLLHIYEVIWAFLLCFSDLIKFLFSANMWNLLFPIQFKENTIYRIFFIAAKQLLLKLNLNRKLQ